MIGCYSIAVICIHKVRIAELKTETARCNLASFVSIRARVAILGIVELLNSHRASIHSKAGGATVRIS